MKATLLLKANIDALLDARGQKRKDLAQWCRRSDSWISKIFRDDKKEMPQQYLDRIADFFGLATYQLYQPGISPLTERRIGERRKGRDRRVSVATRQMREVQAELERVRPGAGGRTHAAASLADQVRRLTADYETRLSALLSQADTGGQTSTTGGVVTEPPLRRRTHRGPHAPKVKEQS